MGKQPKEFSDEKKLSAAHTLTRATATVVNEIYEEKDSFADIGFLHKSRMVPFFRAAAHSLLIQNYTEAAARAVFLAAEFITSVDHDSVKEHKPEIERVTQSALDTAIRLSDDQDVNEDILYDLTQAFCNVYAYAAPEAAVLIRDAWKNLVEVLVKGPINATQEVIKSAEYIEDILRKPRGNLLHVEAITFLRNYDQGEFGTAKKPRGASRRKRAAAAHNSAHG